MFKVTKVLIFIILTLSMSLAWSVGSSVAGGLDTDREIQELKWEMEKLRERIEALERKRAEERELIEQMKAEERLIESEVANLRRYVDRRIEKFSVFNTSKLFLSGYGAAAFTNPDDEPSTFSAIFTPIFHYQLTDRIHFIIAPEFELEDDELEVRLEIGEIDIILNDYLTLVAGKFLLPFNVFSERLHPTWINKMPALPVIYGHGHGGGGIVPILSDVGVQLRGGAPLPLWKGSKINYAFYVTNGPRLEMEEHEESEEHEEEPTEEGAALAAARAVELEFSENFTDLNSNKAVGGRIGILPVWNIELGASLMYADVGSDIDVFLLGLDGELHYRGFELRGEFIRLQHDEGEEGDDEDRNGFYVQGAWRVSDITLANPKIQNFINRLEPVVRYGRVYRLGEDLSQFAFGINYWIMPSVPFKIAYQLNEGQSDNFLVQLAFGF